jgi:hypothetical protein
VASGLVPLALLAAACERPARGELHVIVDTTVVSAVQEVLALPFDPAALLARHEAPQPALPDGPRGDSLRSFGALRDSASALDAAFQRERAALHRDAAAMRAMDRLSSAYAERFDQWTRRAAAADSLRSARDRLRRRMATLRARLGDALPAEEPENDVSLTRTSVDSASRAGRHTVAASPAMRGSATLELATGRWWITAQTRDGEVLVPAVPLEIGPDARDTVRIPER